MTPKWQTGALAYYGASPTKSPDHLVAPAEYRSPSRGSATFAPGDFLRPGHGPHQRPSSWHAFQGRDKKMYSAVFLFWSFFSGLLSTYCNFFGTNCLKFRAAVFPTSLFMGHISQTLPPAIEPTSHCGSIRTALAPNEGANTSQDICYAGVYLFQPFRLNLLRYSFQQWICDKYFGYLF